MAGQGVISADSHMTEPADLWVARLDRGLKDRAPHVIENEGKRGYSFVAPGVRPFPVAGGFATGRSGKELLEHMNKGYEAARPSGWDPAERLKDQDIDGVAAEVLYTTLGMPLFGLSDGHLQRACFKVYNDWVAEFASYSPKRLHPIALVSLDDVAEGVKELERAAKIGLKGAMIWGVPPEDRPYLSEIYDPFWAAAQSLEMPLSLHVLTQREQRAKPRSERSVLDSGRLGFLMAAMGSTYQIQRSICSLIFGKVFDRFPRLKIVSAENDSGWVPHFIYRADHMYEKFGTMSDTTTLKLRPGDYMRRNLWVTFQDDMVGPMTYRLFGEDNYMWASDFPHADSTWPNSRNVIEQDFAGIPDHVKHKIVHENAAKLYRIELD